MKQGFEDRLLELAGAENLAAGKQILKNNTSINSWRDFNGKICGSFPRKGGLPHVCRVTPGEAPVSTCSCPEQANARLCPHGVALIMYAGRFGCFKLVPEDKPPVYYQGLAKSPISSLIKKLRIPDAVLVIDAPDFSPHAPSKWEETLFTVKIKTKQREYMGNLNNLRQLYFEKSVSAALSFDQLDLQDKQIVRFMAVNGEANSAKIALSAELTCELFHSLVGFKNFYSNGVRLTINKNTAQPVMLYNKGKFLPGIYYNHALLPILDSKIIMGHSGLWIGVDREYFFVPATYEIGFMRNFFRAGTHSAPESMSDEQYKEACPFPVIDIKSTEIESKKASLSLEGFFENNRLILQIEYIYSCSNGKISVLPRSGQLGTDNNRFWKRDAAFEKYLESSLEMFGFKFQDSLAVLEGCESCALFLDEFLPSLLKLHKDMVIGPNLANASFGGNGLPEVKFNCKLLNNEANGYRVGFSLQLDNEKNIYWQDAHSSSLAYNKYVYGKDGYFGKLSASLSAFLRASANVIQDVYDGINDLQKSTFFIPIFNIDYFNNLVKDIPGAVLWELMNNNYSVGEQVQFIPEFTFKGQLRNYQQEGVNFLRRMTDRNFNVILADQMGLGKTVQLLAFLASRLRRNGSPALILCPASLVANWENEAKKFVPDFRVKAPLGNERNKFFNDKIELDILILSYSSARLAKEKLSSLKFSYLILDEAQHIKNPGTSNAKNCKSIASEHRIVLSGTPLENSPEDLWSIMDFLHPDMLGSLSSFRKKYGQVATDDELRNDLACRISPFILRRTKDEVAKDLPEKTELVLYCDFGPEQRKLYDKVLAQGRKQLEEKSDFSSIFTVLLRLRQICCHPELLPDNLGENIPSAKQELVMELLQETIDSSHKVLLFSQFTSLLNLLKENLNKEEIPFEYLDGNTETLARQHKVDKFNKSKDLSLFLLSLKAGGTGLNLTGADTVIIYDPWWNPAIEAQAADRSHRIGQNKPVTVLRLVARNTIEEKILTMQESKREIFNALVDNPTANSSLTLDELRNLLDT